MPRKKRHKLLLDENLPRKEIFSELNFRHDLKHVVGLGMAGSKDPQLALEVERTGRVLITINRKDFRSLKGTHSFGLIAIDQKMSWEEADKKICAFLRRVNPRWLGETHISPSPRKRK